jgi:hypothetical protein
MPNKLHMAMMKRRKHVDIISVVELPEIKNILTTIGEQLISFPAS